MDIGELRKEYKDSVRNLSSEQVAQVESGVACDSPVMAHARTCYLSLRSAEAALSKEAGFDQSFMMQL